MTDQPTGTYLDGIIVAPTLGVDFVQPWTLDAYFDEVNRLWVERGPQDD